MAFPVETQDSWKSWFQYQQWADPQGPMMTPECLAQVSDQSPRFWQRHYLREEYFEDWCIREIHLEEK